MNTEYVNLKIKRDILREALNMAIMHAGTIRFIRGVHASIATAEQSMKEWMNKEVEYN